MSVQAPKRSQPFYGYSEKATTNFKETNSCKNSPIDKQMFKSNLSIKFHVKIVQDGRLKSEKLNFTKLRLHRDLFFFFGALLFRHRATPLDFFDKMSALYQFYFYRPAFSTLECLNLLGGGGRESDQGPILERSAMFMTSDKTMNKSRQTPHEYSDVS